MLSIALLHMVGFSVLMAIGLTFIPTGRSVVLAYTTPLWVTPGASLFLHERLTPRRAAGVVMGLLGLVVLFNPLAFDWSNRTAVLGNGALVLAALLWAASIVHIRGHRLARHAVSAPPVGDAAGRGQSSRPWPSPCTACPRRAGMRR